MLQPYKKFLVYVLILSVIFIPAQSLAAIAMGDGVGHSFSKNAVSKHAVSKHAMPGHNFHNATQQLVGNNVSNNVSNNKVPTSEHHAVKIKDSNHCQKTKSLCNQCGNCSHCINLIDCSVWSITKPENHIVTTLPEIIQSRDSHLLFRPPISS